MRFRADDLPLDDGRFQRIFAAEAISLLGAFVAPVALVFAVLSISDAAGLGFVLAASEIPLVALLLGGGVIADRRSPRSLMMAADAVRAVSQGLTAALLITGRAELWHVVALQALNGAAQAFGLPAQTGLIADVVAPGQLQAANSLRAFARSVANIAGPAVAGVLVVAVGPGWGLAADAATFAASALLLATVTVEHRPVAVGRRLLTDLREGWRTFRASDWLWGGMTLMSAWNATFAINATWESTIQREVPRAALSRVMAYDMFGSFGLAPIGLVLGGLLVEPLGATTTLFAAGILLGALAGMLWAIPGIRRLRAGV